MRQARVFHAQGFRVYAQDLGFRLRVEGLGFTPYDVGLSLIVSVFFILFYFFIFIFYLGLMVLVSA